MDHRLIYKINGSVLSPKNCKRKIANEIRATKRSELYSSTRKISLSPRREVLQSEQKENFKPPLAVASLRTEETASGGETRLDPESSKIVERQSRQKAYLMRFLAWKAQKEKLKEQKSKRAPFVVPTRTTVQQEMESKISKKSVLNRYVFNPPANLENLTIEVAGKNSIRCVNGGQQVTYHFVETPKKKQNIAPKPVSAKPSSLKKPSQTPIGPKFPLTSSKTPFGPKLPATSSKTPIEPKLPSTSSKMPIGTKLPPTSSKTPIGPKLPSTSSKTPIEPKLPSTSSKTPIGPKLTSTSSKTPIGPKLPSTSSKTPIRPKFPPTLQQASKPAEKPQTNMNLKCKMPPPSQLAPKTIRKPQSLTAGTKSVTTKLVSSKTGLPPLKRPTFKASKKSNASISNAFQAVNANTRSKVITAYPTLKLNGKAVLQSMTKANKLPDPIPETPTDLNPVSFLNFVTSTKRKSSASKDAKADLLFAELGNTISPVDDCSSTPSEQNSKHKSGKEFHFVRYSIVQSDKDSATTPEEEEKPKSSDRPDEEANSTPEKTSAPPTTYMSPYVSVSRGKVSTKIEKEKRNSIYMADDNAATAIPEATAAIRHTLATVRYYRKQLMDEIGRLNDLCASWEQYKEANAQLVEDGGVDMINVTIGQTKLLTTKKLKQFGGLIDRCEDGVLGKISTCNGGGDSAKPILSEDLEGFWSMVGLQIENVDKRFAELERWKANNWNDPDDIPTKPTNSLVNVKKTKKRKPVTSARPNGALQKMLRTAHAAYLNKKAVSGADEDVILTPSKSRQVLIKDRRSRSAAATVITVNTPRTNRKSPALEATDLNETPKLLPHVNGFRKSLNLLKSTLMAEQERKSPVTECISPLRNPAMFRKSILKTPGSISRPKSVIFHGPTVEFTIEDTMDEPEARTSGEDDEDQRMYTLRNRRIILRDSAEFVIPK